MCTNTTVNSTEVDAPASVSTTWLYHVSVATYLIVPTVFLGPYLLMLKIMVFGKDFMGKSCYKFMFHLGVCDVLQLLANMAAGVMGLFNVSYPSENLLAKLASASLVKASWQGYSWFMLLIAINRVSTVCLPEYDQLLFNHISVPVGLRNYMLITMGHLLHVSTWIGCIARVHCVAYSSVVVSWGNDPPSSVYSELDFYWHKATICMAVICYALVFNFVRKQRSDASSSRTLRTQQRRREVRIALQGTLITVFAMLAAWENILFFFDGFPPVALYLCNCAWIANSCVNPVIYIALNELVHRTRMERFRKD